MTAARTFVAVALLTVLPACCAPPEAPEPPTTPAPTAVLIPPASCRKTPAGPVCDPPEVGPDPSTPSTPG